MNSHLNSTVQFLHSDELSITATEPWFKVKVQVMQSYLQAFVTTVVGRVDDIVVIDLFAGSGLYSVGYQREIFASTSLASLSSNLPVTKWILCESNTEQCTALRVRISKYFRSNDVLIFDSSPTELVDKLGSCIPSSKGGRKVAVLCIVDPFSLEMPFGVMDKLASQGFSFLVPFTFMLNERVNYQYYLKEHPEKLKYYLGEGGKERLRDVESNIQFYKRLIRIYQNNMLMLGLNASTSVHKVHSTLMELPAYYIGFFSRQFSTKAIQNDVRLSEHMQFELF